MAAKLELVQGGLDAPFWRDNPEFRENILYKGTCWWIYLAPAPQQTYLGRAYAWLMTRHVTSHPLHDLTQEEWVDLRVLMDLYLQTIRCFWPAILNYHWDGNETQHHDGHGHMHLIPRYNTVQRFEGHEFHDERLGKSHSPYTKLDLPRDVFMALHNRISHQMEYISRLE